MKTKGTELRSHEDPVGDLEHDHADLNRCVLALGTVIRALCRDPGERATQVLVAPLDELREVLFRHFACEEEGMFPFIAETFPDLADAVEAMALAHDAICGAVARMYNLAAVNSGLAEVAQVFDRFERTYANHASLEAALLRGLALRIDATQRARLARLVEGL